MPAKQALCAGRTTDTTEMQVGEDIKIIKLPLKQNALFNGRAREEVQNTSVEEPRASSPPPHPSPPLSPKYLKHGLLTDSLIQAIAQDYLNLLHSATTPIRTITHLLPRPT